MKGAEPPVAVTVAVYGLPKFPAGRLVEVIFSGPGVLLHPPIPIPATSTANNGNRNPPRFTMATLLKLFLGAYELSNHLEHEMA
jgi:hypothetical protein